MKRELLPQTKATALCAGHAGFADRLTVGAPTGNTRGESDQTGERRAARTWLNSASSAGDNRRVAGVELAAASEPPCTEAWDLGASPFGRRRQPPPEV